ncbi:hypothetical protein Tco_1040955 [Tanacetum coccineum]|uniref:Retroviral polymerase SH3-like domain-containing protein n=1 Tax=Tanacetum coccineum TaxID=301880 RepID=A0ABQ5GFG2_9ASTR
MRECTCDVIEKFIERDSNSKLIQFLMKLSDGYESVRSQVLAMDPLPSMNKAYYIVQQIEKQKQVTNHVFEPTAFCANMNNKGGNSSRRDVKTRRNDSRHEVKRLCTHCNQEGHTVDQCIEKIRYLDWYKGKKAKKSTRIASHVNSRFDEHFHCDTPFDMGSENEVGFGQNGGVDQKLVAAVCQEMMKMFKGKGIIEDKNYAGTSHADIMCLFTASFALFCHPNMNIKQDWDPSTKEIIAVGKGSRCLYICKPTTDQVTFFNSVSEFSNSHKQLSPTVCFNKDAYSNSMYKQSVDVHIFHARLGHTCVSKLIHIPVCNSMDLSKFSSVTKPNKDKFDNRGVKCVLLGYPQNQKGYKLYDLNTKEIFLSRDVVFDETMFPFKGYTFTHPNITPSMPTFGDIFLDEENGAVPNTPLFQSTTQEPII